MPTITFPKQDLKRFLAGSVEDDTLKEAMTMIGTDIASFDEEIIVEVFPNRPDLLSVQGLARALNHFLGFIEDVDTYPIEDGKGIVRILESAKGVRAHTRCAIVRGLDFDSKTIKHVIDIQEKLHVTFGRNRKKVAIGIYPLEKIVFPITFGAEEPSAIVFRPLESQKEMNAKQLLEEHPTGKKYAQLLSQAKNFPVFRDAKGKVLSVPPIINSHDVGKITEETTAVFIECSGNEIQPLEQALAMICCALSDMGGHVERMRVEYPEGAIVSPLLETKKAHVNREYVLSRAGIPEQALETSLQRMGLHLHGTVLSIPCYRTDFLHDVDVVEDALIGYGYQNVEPRIPNLSTTGKLAHNSAVYTAIRDVLCGAGLLEIMNYYLVEEGVALSNPLNLNYGALRKELLPQLIQVLTKNTANSYPQNIFEIGPVFEKDIRSSTRIEEKTRLCIVLCGDHADYTKARQVLELLASNMQWKLSYEEQDNQQCIPGRCVRVNGSIQGFVGEIHPQLLVSQGIYFPASCFEIELPK